jgi:ERF superfamily.
MDNKMLDNFTDSQKHNEVLQIIQQELKAPKNQRNNFGNYNYRSCEDILEAVKPLCAKHSATLILSDEIVVIGVRFYVKATALFICCDTTTTVSAFAREAENKKGMDESQVTGAASSYARKYALNGLFLIDDTKDADTDEHTKQTKIEPVKPLEYMTDAQETEIVSYGSEIEKVKSYYRTDRLTKAQAEQALQKLRRKAGGIQ